jgi:outer membrane protein
MKRIVLAMVAAIGLLSINMVVEAAVYGVVDIQQIFHTAPQIQKINAQLNQEFSAKKAAIIKQGQTLQANLAKYKKQSLVSTDSQLSSLKAEITKQEEGLRQAQAEFQKELYTEQSKKMAGFMAKMKAVIQNIAKDKNLDLVLPMNAVLYSKSNLNITAGVLKSLD